MNSTLHSIHGRDRQDPCCGTGGTDSSSTRHGCGKMMKMLHAPGRYLAACLLAAAAGSLTAGCSIGTAGTMVDLKINLRSEESGGAAERTLGQTSGLTAVEYHISGSGPEGNTFDITTQNDSVTIEGILVGDWTISAEGFNEFATCIFSGEVTETITEADPNVIIPLSPQTGSGNILINFSWDCEGMGSLTLHLYVDNQTDPEQTIDWIPEDQGDGYAVLDTSLDAGSYIIRGELYQDTEIIGGFAESIRIMPGHSHTYDYTILVNRPEIESGITLLETTSPPIEGTITGYPDAIYAGNSMELEFIPDNPPDDPSQMNIAWYSDGSFLQDGTTCTITPEAGFHQINVIADIGIEGSWGSSTYIYEALSPGDNSNLTLIQTLQNDDTTYLLDGVNDIETAGSDCVLAASQISDALQLYRQNPDGTLALCDSIEDSENIPLNGITDIAVSPDSSYVCAVSLYDSSISIFSLDTQAGTINYVTSITGTLGLDPDYTISQLSDVLITPDGTDIFCADKDTNMIYQLSWDGSTLTAQDVLDTASTAGLDSLRELAVSPDGTFIAAAGYDSSTLGIFRIQTDGTLQYEDSFSYNTTGTSGLSQVNNCSFDQYGNLYTTSDTFLACFTYDDTVDEFSFAARIKEGDEGVGYMSGPKSITIDDTAGMGYVCSSSSGGIAAVDISSPGLLQYAAFTPCGAVNASAIDADRSYIYAVSFTDDAVYAFSIDQ